MTINVFLDLILCLTILIVWIFLIWNKYHYQNTNAQENVFERHDNIGNSSYLNPYYIAQRRRAASINKCRKFLKRNKNNFTISNNLVTLIFSTDGYTFLCYNKKNIEQRFNAGINNWKSGYEDYLEQTNEIFDTVCSSFDKNSTYKGIKDFFSEFYKFQNDDIKKPKTVKKTKNDNIITVEEYFRIKDSNTIDPVNINTASAEEIAKLPGINIVMAKKIINYRELNNGFNSKEEFFMEMKIKQYFIDKIDKLIIVEKSQDSARTVLNDDERIIDL